MTPDSQVGAQSPEPPVRIGIIGGSGLYRMEGLSDVEHRSISTPFGEPSDDVIVGALDGVPVAFLARHGRGHRLMPSEVNYRANIFALKSLGVEQIVSVSACGSLREQIHPGEVVIPNQLFDFTKRREYTFFGDGLVAHIGTAEPFCPRLSALVADAVEAAGGTVHRHGRFITIEGPRFSTKGESFAFRSWDMDIIGMTTSPEAFLAREAEICYAVMAHVTDYDVWHETEEEVTVEAVIRVLQQNTALAQQAIRALVPELAQVERTCACGEALATSIITDRETIPEATKERLAPIVGKYLE
ncbi:MAG: S-methyl-5'-thioadenosine phosphorylase [Chloroflexota bacterium]|nr:S-methyl-5'-thioadenosine phosphorylase [Chloroflexota bacterium]